MKKRHLSGQELLDAWRKKEEDLRRKREIEHQLERAEKLRTTPHECMHCKHSWYRYVEPTGCFTESSEFCGCRLKMDLVDPHGVCESFDP